MDRTQVKKYLRTGIFVLIFIVSGWISGHAETLRVGFFPIQPHAIVKSPGAYTGAAIEYFSRLSELMGITSVRFFELPLARLVVSLEREEIEVILFFAKNSQREHLFEYPETPYYCSQPGVAVKLSSPISAISSAEDLFPLKIGMLGRGYLSPFMRHERIQLQPLYGSTPILQNLKKLMAGYLDAIYVPDVTVVQYEAQKHGYNGQLRFVPTPEPPLANYSVFPGKVRRSILPNMNRRCMSFRRQFPMRISCQNILSETQESDLMQKIPHVKHKCWL